MDVKISCGDLRINIEDLLRQIPVEQRIKLAEILSCDSEVLKFVIQQILDGHTENGHYSGLCCYAHANTGGVGGLDWACREVAKRAGETAMREINRLEDALRHAEAQIEKLREDMRRNWEARNL